MNGNPYAEAADGARLPGLLPRPALPPDATASLSRPRRRIQLRDERDDA